MSRHVFSGVITAITILSLFAPISSQGAEKGDALLETIPADVAFCVRINNLNQTTGVLDQYLMGVAPVTTTGLIKGQLGMMFGNFELKGFDTNGAFAIFATAESGEQAPNIYFLLPVTDYDQIIDPNFRVSQPDANGISMVGTGPKGQFFLKQVRSFALMSKDYGKLGEMAGSISGEKAAGLVKSLDIAQAKEATSEPIWVYANMVKISDVYKKEISDGIEEMKKHAANPGAGIQQQIDNLEQTKSRLAAADPNSPAIGSIDAQIESLKARKERLQAQKTPAAMAGMMDAFGTLLKDFIQQTKSVTLVCNPKPTVLNFRAGVNALPGTEMAEMLVAGAEHPAKNDLAGFAEDGAAMNFVGWMNNKNAMKKMYAKSIDLMAKAAGKDPNAADNIKIKKLCDEMVDSMGDRLVCTFSIDPNAKPLFDAKYVLAVKDADKFNKTIDEFVKTWAGSAFDEFYKGLGIETGFAVKRGVDNYKGISIDTATLSMKFADMNSPEAMMLNAMYGKGFDYRWAAVDGLWVCRISSDPNAIYTLIEQVKAGPPSQVCSEMQKAFAIIPDADKSDVIFTYNYLRLFKMMSAMMPAEMPQMNIPSKSNLVFAAKAEKGTLAIDAALPKEHLQEMMMAFQMMMQMQMQKQMQQMPPKSP
ncbi:MAG: hypothetical protein ABII09_06570 [Planctomycetota bacterium]